MTPAFQLWDPLLTLCVVDEPSFLNVLLSELVTRIATNLSSTRISKSADEDVGVASDPYHEAIYLWLVHLLFESTWDSFFQKRQFTQRKRRRRGITVQPAQGKEVGHEGEDDEEEEAESDVNVEEDVDDSSGYNIEKDSDSAGVMSFGSKSRNGKRRDRPKYASIDWNHIISSCLKDRTFWSLKLLRRLILTINQDEESRQPENRRRSTLAERKRRRLKRDWFDLIHRALAEQSHIGGSENGQPRGILGKEGKGLGKEETGGTATVQRENEIEMEVGQLVKGGGRRGGRGEVTTRQTDTPTDVTNNSITMSIQREHIGFGRRREMGHDPSGDNPPPSDNFDDAAAADNEDDADETMKMDDKTGSREQDEEEDDDEEGRNENEIEDEEEEEEEEEGEEGPIWRKWRGPWIAKPIGII